MLHKDSSVFITIDISEFALDSETTINLLKHIKLNNDNNPLKKDKGKRLSLLNQIINPEPEPEDLEIEDRKNNH